VAILQKDAASPAFAVTVNLDKQELTVSSGRDASAARQIVRALAHRLEAWRALAWRDWDAPRGASLSAYDPRVVADATYAVTVEPPGGSPTGQPSGAPVLSAS